MSKKEVFLNTAVSAAHGKLFENAITIFVWLSDAMKALGSVYDMDVWQLTKLYEMETGNCLFKYAVFVLTPIHSEKEGSKYRLWTRLVHPG